MDGYEFDQEQRFRDAWQSVAIARPVHYSLFTFGESLLPYVLVRGDTPSSAPVSVAKGEVRITRPTIITPENARPEFRGFFEDAEEEDLLQFLLARTASFSSLKFDNQSGSAKLIHKSMEEVVAQLNRQLDAEGEDRMAILTAPKNLGGLALVRYAVERVVASGPDNLQELRERGFLT